MSGEEASEILEMIINRTKTTSSEQKREMYVNTFLNLILNKNEISHELKISIIESIELLTVHDINIFMKIPNDININVKEFLNSLVELSGTKHERLSSLIATLSKLIIKRIN